jgi:hypothetical protein
VKRGGARHEQHTVHLRGSRALINGSLAIQNDGYGCGLRKMPSLGEDHSFVA